MATQSEWRKLRKGAEAQGWSTEQGKRHMKLIAPNGKKLAIPRSSTAGSGSRRTMLNTLAAMSRLDPNFDKRKVSV